MYSNVSLVRSIWPVGVVFLADLDLYYVKILTFIPTLWSVCNPSLWPFRVFSPDPNLGCLFDNRKRLAGNRICFSVLIAPIHGTSLHVWLLQSLLLLKARASCYVVLKGFQQRNGVLGDGEDVTLWSAAFVPNEHPCSDLNAVCNPLDSLSVWFVCCSSCHSIM